jgi:glutamate synthase (NADPH/NADH) small chain
MPGSRREVEHAEEEGVRFEWLAAPRAILGDADHVAGVRAQRMRLAAPDLAGRRSVEEAPGAEFDLPATMVVEALGFEPEDLKGRFALADLECGDDGTIKVARGGTATNLPGVFAAGDIVRGASLVVWAVRDGQRAAEDIHAWLQAQQARAA